MVAQSHGCRSPFATNIGYFLSQEDVDTIKQCITPHHQHYNVLVWDCKLVKVREVSAGGDDQLSSDTPLINSVYLAVVSRGEFARSVEATFQFLAIKPLATTDEVRFVIEDDRDGTDANNPKTSVDVNSIDSVGVLKTILDGIKQLHPDNDNAAMAYMHERSRILQEIRWLREMTYGLKNGYTHILRALDRLELDILSSGHITETTNFTLLNIRQLYSVQKQLNHSISDQVPRYTPNVDPYRVGARAYSGQHSFVGQSSPSVWLVTIDVEATRVIASADPEGWVKNAAHYNWVVVGDRAVTIVRDPVITEQLYTWLSQAARDANASSGTHISRHLM